MLDIYDYFKESTTDNIDDALEELGDDFTEEEVRLFVSNSYLKWQIDFLSLALKKENLLRADICKWNKKTYICTQ